MKRLGFEEKTFSELELKTSRALERVVKSCSSLMNTLEEKSIRRDGVPSAQTWRAFVLRCLLWWTFILLVCGLAETYRISLGAAVEVGVVGVVGRGEDGRRVDRDRKDRRVLGIDRLGRCGG